jgi:hypothetical protein
MPKAKKEVIQEAEEEVSNQLEESGALIDATEQPAEETAPSSQVKGDFPDSVPVVVGPFGVSVYQVIQDGKGNARIYGKRGEPISGVMPIEIASRTASRHNAMDPEQIDGKSRARK